MNRGKGIFFLLPSLIGFSLFYIGPFMLSIGYAFMNRPIKGQFVGLQNFLGLLSNKSYQIGLENTFIFMGISIPLITVLALILAMIVKETKGYKKLFTLLFLIPLVIPSGSMVFFWKMFFANQGYLNSLLSSIGIEPISWLEDAVVRYVVIFIFIWKNIGYNIILFLAGLSNIPKEYYEAASVEGANKWQKFMGITLCSLIPTIFLVVMMSIINSFKVFKEVFLITGNYPHESIYMLQHFMNNMFKSLNYPKLTTATCLLVVIIALMMRVLFQVERKMLS